MVRRFYLLTLSVFVILTVIGEATVAAQGSGPRRGVGVGMARRALDLTDAQREQMRQLAQKNREQIRTLTDRAEAAREAAREAADVTSFSEEQSRAAAEEVAAAQVELAVHRARSRSEVYALLTPDQQQRARNIRDRLQQRQPGPPRFRGRGQQRQPEPPRFRGRGQQPQPGPPRFRGRGQQPGPRSRNR